MTLLLRVLSGARAGHVLSTDLATVRIGRNEGLELRFDPELDLEVSGRHATITVDAERALLRDEGSRNGTFVNGVRVDGSTELEDGDRIIFGAAGPEVQFHVMGSDRTRAFPGMAGAAAEASGPQGESTAERLRVELSRRTRRWKHALGALVLVLCSVIGVAVFALQSERRSWDRERASMLARIDSAVGAGEQTIQSLEGELEELADALRESQRQVRGAAAALERADRGGEAGRVPALRSELEGALANLSRQQDAAELDHDKIRRRNDRAVAKVFVEYESGEVATGTAFAVRSDATLVTSRHVVVQRDGRPPRRIAVQFSYSDQVWPARLLLADDEVDLAIVKVDGILGSVPTVQPFNLRGDTIASGTPVMLIGYPGGGESEPSSRVGRNTIRPVIGAGMVAAVTGGLIELRGYGATGSSGSPVFDGNGEVIAVAFGGRREAGVHHLVAVPAAATARLLARIPAGLSSP